jgi:anaerobic selenocysteine-containing dehydrogenase
MSPSGGSPTAVAEDFRNRPLLVSRFLATRMSDPDRGPQVHLRPDDAADRLLQPGELAWVYGPRRQELATVVYDDSLRRGEVVLRDVAGASPSELVRVVKPDLDSHTRRGHFA